MIAVVCWDRCCSSSCGKKNVHSCGGLVEIFLGWLETSLNWTIGLVAHCLFIEWLVCSLQNHLGVTLTTIGGALLTTFWFLSLFWERSLSQRLIMLQAALCLSLFFCLDYWSSKASFPAFTVRFSFPFCWFTNSLGAQCYGPMVFEDVLIFSIQK